MDCKRVREVIFLFFDNEMGDDLLTPFNDHVSRCGHCAHEMDHTRKFLFIVRQRCLRCTAPESLRHRILISLPHRGSRGLESETPH
jgi:mycothiol system anti-sigma-R factor